MPTLVPTRLMCSACGGGARLCCQMVRARVRVR